jgi:acetylornithine/N-succinyldiaminopimelate aminotransferase
VAVMVEPIQGEAGIVIPPAGYLAALRQLCDRKGWLLLLDEIQSGNGRTGSYFQYQRLGVRPDLVTTAKGLGNGFPIGACLATEAVAQRFTPGSHGTTFGGNPLAARVAFAVVEEIQQGSWGARAQQRGAELLAGLQQRLAGLSPVREVRGEGLMLAVEMNQPCGDLVAVAARDGLIINVTGGNRVRLLPPLTLSDAEAEYLLDRLVGVISQWGTPA